MNGTCGRKRVLANGGLLEVHLGACQQAVVDFMYAAGAVLQQRGPVSGRTRFPPRIEQNQSAG